MNEQELIEHALQTVKNLIRLLDQAYQLHDHDNDLVGGVFLSSAKFFAKAIEESLISISVYLSRKE
jgi:hypothetical protein